MYSSLSADVVKGADGFSKIVVQALVVYPQTPESKLAFPEGVDEYVPSTVTRVPEVSDSLFISYSL
jgi:hypothetical protein